MHAMHLVCWMCVSVVCLHLSRHLLAEGKPVAHVRFDVPYWDGDGCSSRILVVRFYSGEF